MASNIIDTDAKIIAADQFGFGQPVLCRCSSTLMFAAHINDSSELEIHKSIDDGVNWSLVKTFTETDPGDFEMCPIDSTSAAIAFVYTGNNIVYATTDSGLTWVEKATYAYERKISIAYDPLEDRLWTAFCRTPFWDYIDLRYSDNKGDNWTDKSYDIQPLQNHEVLDMDISLLDSKVYIIIIKLNESFLQRYIFSKIGIPLSSDPIDPSSAIGETEFYDACIVVDSEGNDYMLFGYKYKSDSKYYIAYAKNVGDLTFSASNFLLGPADNYNDLIIPGSLSCAVDGDDNIYVFYTKASDEKCYYRKYNGSTWESEVELIAAANDRISTEKRPISGSNKLHFCYYKSP